MLHRSSSAQSRHDPFLYYTLERTLSIVSRISIYSSPTSVEGLPLSTSQLSLLATVANISLSLSFRTMPVATLVYDRNGEYLSDTKDHAYIFKGDQYWKWDLKNDKAVDSYPRKISDKWPGLPNDVDATLTYDINGPYKSWAKHSVYMFKGDQYWKWNLNDNKVGPQHPKYISDGFPGLPNDIDATLTFDINGPCPAHAKNYAYIFKGDKYWKWDLKTHEIVKFYPRKISNGFPGLPSDIDATLTYDRNGPYPPSTTDFAFIFKGDKYWKYSIQEDKTVEGPKSISDGFPGLPAFCRKRQDVYDDTNQVKGMRGQKIYGDTDQGDDRLGLRTIAEVLAESLVFADSVPPLVLGILGMWGRGKSYFFNLMLDHLIGIQKSPANSSLFAGHIYVIKFDAWTFSKGGNIWSSLMIQILKSLNEQLQFEDALKENGLIDKVSTIEVFFRTLSRQEIKYMQDNQEVLIN